MTRRLPDAWRSGLLLAAIAVVAVAVLTAVHSLTRERIAEQETAQTLRQLNQILEPGAYDNAPDRDLIYIRDPEAFRHPDPVTVYRARKDGEPVAVIMQVTAPDGYNGDIRLLVGIRYDGTVSGVRVVSHRETPGLGDPIEERRSDWIHGFRGRSLGDPPKPGWAVRSDGGIFDQFTGATITPRAVVEAVQRALEYHERHRGALYEGVNP